MLETLTVGELKLALKNFSDDTPVVSCIAYGDRVGTMQAIPVSELELGSLKETAYSDSGYAVVTEEDSDEDNPTVLVLNYDYL